MLNKYEKKLFWFCLIVLLAGCAKLPTKVEMQRDLKSAREAITQACGYLGTPVVEDLKILWTERKGDVLTGRVWYQISNDVPFGVGKKRCEEEWGFRYINAREGWEFDGFTEKFVGILFGLRTEESPISILKIIQKRVKKIIPEIRNFATYTRENDLVFCFTISEKKLEKLNRSMRFILGTSQLSLHLVYDGNDPIPQNYEILRGRQGNNEYVVKKNAELTNHIAKTNVEVGGQYNMPYFSVQLDKEGTKIFAQITKTNYNQRLAIILDGTVLSAPVIRSEISDGRFTFEGNFSLEEAKNIATILKIGPLPSKVVVTHFLTTDKVIDEFWSNQQGFKKVIED